MCTGCGWGMYVRVRVRTCTCTYVYVRVRVRMQLLINRAFTGNKLKLAQLASEDASIMYDGVSGAVANREASEGWIPAALR